GRLLDQFPPQCPLWIRVSRHCGGVSHGQSRPAALPAVRAGAGRRADRVGGATAVTPAARRAALIAVFFAIAAATIFRHEMWMDELNTWDVVRDATGLGSLFANMHLEVHPALWYLALYPVTRLTADPRAMQFLHLLIATATAAVIVWA